MRLFSCIPQDSLAMLYPEEQVAGCTSCEDLVLEFWQGTVQLCSYSLELHKLQQAAASKVPGCVCALQ